MTSKCGKNKKVAHEAIAECVTDVLTTFWRLLWSIIEQTHGKIYDSKAGHCPHSAHFDKQQQKNIWRNLLSILMKQCHRLLCVAKEFWLVPENHATVKLTRASLLMECKLTAKAKLNCEIYKSWRKCWNNTDSFCHQSSPFSPGFRVWFV